MDMICYLDIIPKEIKDYIISLTQNKIYDLCQVNKYFDDNCKIIRIVDNFKYTNLSNINLKILINLTSLRLCSNDIITDEAIKDLINLTFLNLMCNNIITSYGIKGLINLTYFDLCHNDKITDGGIKGLINLTYLNLSYNNIII